jgi:hypothetical protein
MAGDPAGDLALKRPCGAELPALLGELSRRLASELAVQNLLFSSTGLVLNSSGPELRRLVAVSGMMGL